MKELLLREYDLFLSEFPKDWQHLSGLAHIPLRYFYLSGVQIQNFFSALEQSFQNRSIPNTEDYSEKCYSFCYGFYVLIRTCLEVSGKFNDAFQKEKFSPELAEYRESVKDEIQDIIDIANNFVKHPVENNGKVTWYEPGGLDSSGTLSLYEWSTQDNDHFKVLEIHPKKDYEKVYNYLEKLASIYVKNLK